MNFAKIKLHPKIRPYWHVDAKWVCGILLFFALGASLVLGVLHSVTSKGVAIEITASVMASLLDREGADPSEGMIELRQKIAASPDKKIAPIESFPSITISEKDLELSPDALKLKVIRQIIVPIYEKGVEGAAQEFTSNKDERKKFIRDAGALQFLTKQTHENIGNMLVITIVLSVIATIGVVYFSWRWGRLANPGLIFVLLGFPGTLVGLMLSYPHKDGDGGPLAMLPPETAAQIGNVGFSSYRWILGIGVVLLVSALVGKISTRVRTKK